MKLNNLEIFKQTVSSGRTAAGCVIESSDTCVSEIAAEVGFDFIWIDMEHSPMPLEAAMHHVMAMRGTQCAPFIRVPTNSPWVIKQVIDFVPAGIIVPMVNTPEEARRAVAACRYPKQNGVRGIGARRSLRYGLRPMEEHLRETEEGDPMIILQIEHRQAVENLDAILAVPGWDSVCVGPCDLSTSYQKTNTFRDPEVREAIKTIFRKVPASGHMLGGYLPDACLPDMDTHIDWRATIGDYDALAMKWRTLVQQS